MKIKSKHLAHLYSITGGIDVILGDAPLKTDKLWHVDGATWTTWDVEGTWSA